MIKRLVSGILIATIFAWNGLVYVPPVGAEESVSPVPESATVVTEPPPPTQSDPPAPTDSTASSPTPTEVNQTPEQTPTFETTQIVDSAVPESPTPTPQAENNGQVVNDITSNAMTGDNAVYIGSDPNSTDSSPPEADVTPSLELPSQDQVLSSLTPTTSPEEQVSDLTQVSGTPTPIPDQLFTPQSSGENDSVPAEFLSQDQSAAGSGEGAFATQNASTTEIDNDAQVSNVAASLANTGDNAIDNSLSTPAVTDENSESMPVENYSSSSDGEEPLGTGDAVSTVILDNSVNTTSINSNIIYQTINIFNTQSVSLDLTTPYNIVNDIYGNDDKKNEQVINVAVTGVNNYAYISNVITSTANTGGNNILSAGEAMVNTGNAYSVVTLLNKANVTLIDSTIHLITINIFGELNGDIILPELVPTTNCDSGCAVTESAVSNNADVTNVVEANAISGKNTAMAKESADIATGDATSVVNVDNLVNTTLSGVVFYNLNIKTFGEWLGQFIGWDIFSPSSGGNIALIGTSPTTGDGSISLTDPSVINTAIVSNDINSNTITGGNNVEGKRVSITTGNSYSVVSIFNLINTTARNAVGFFSFVNVFGKWVGDIGGASEFAELDSNTDQGSDPQNQIEENTEEVQEVAINTADNSQKEEGGLLEVSQSNNVGEYILPGDTVTFFITVKNSGTGTVYDSKLYLYLLRDGQDVGGAMFSLGDISVGRRVRVTTGLVLSADALGGEYVARAYVVGNVGENNDQVSATSDSTFSIRNTSIVAYNVPEITQPASLSPSVLGSNNIIKPPSKTSSIKLFPLLFLLLVSLLLAIRMKKIKYEIVKNSLKLLMILMLAYGLLGPLSKVSYANPARPTPTPTHSSDHAPASPLTQVLSGSGGGGESSGGGRAAQARLHAPIKSQTSPTICWQ